MGFETAGEQRGESRGKSKGLATMEYIFNHLLESDHVYYFGGGWLVCEPNRV